MVKYQKITSAIVILDVAKAKNYTLLSNYSSIGEINKGKGRKYFISNIV